MKHRSKALTWLILAAAVLCGNHRTKAQQPIVVSLFSEATAIPYTQLLPAPIHPGVQIGTEFKWKEGPNFRLYPGINVGYMYHRHLFQAVFVNVEIGYDYKTSFGINAKGKIGLGYLHTFTTQQEYQFDNGGYVSRADKGNMRVMPSLSLGLGYNLKKDRLQSPEIFVLYQSWIEFPYSPGFIPLMSHVNVHLGTKFFLSTKH